VLDIKYAIFQTVSRVVRIIISLLAGQLRNHGTIPGRNRKYVFSNASSLVLGYTQPCVQCLLRVERTRRDANVLHSPSSKVMNMWSSASTPPYAFLSYSGTELFFLQWTVSNLILCNQLGNVTKI